MAKAKTISDINDKYDYKDENPGGKQDAKLVSCAQCGEYNELSYIYTQKLKPLIDKNKISHEEAIQALDEACAKLENPRTRVKFYEFLTDKLGHTIAA
ncbi:hypothetical protein [Pseudomonas sp. P1.8]|jgi:hypothetical protein|uniref:hypothetical protein n=1 Tax=Pseudomonas sp. P1.8 TaxID=1699310 RepID=UPI00069CDEF0|nr:hypothetical protein [Pseudomonas sp. P1.8]